MDYTKILIVMLAFVLGGIYIVDGIKYKPTSLFRHFLHTKKGRMAHKIYHIAMGVLIMGGALWLFFSE